MMLAQLLLPTSCLPEGRNGSCSVGVSRSTKENTGLFSRWLITQAMGKCTADVIWYIYSHEHQGESLFIQNAIVMRWCSCSQLIGKWCQIARPSSWHMPINSELFYKVLGNRTTWTFNILWSTIFSLFWKILASSPERSLCFVLEKDSRALGVFLMLFVSFLQAKYWSLWKNSI